MYIEKTSKEKIDTEEERKIGYWLRLILVLSITFYGHAIQIVFQMQSFLDFERFFFLHLFSSRVFFLLHSSLIILCVRSHAYIHAPCEVRTANRIPNLECAFNCINFVSKLKFAWFVLFFFFGRRLFSVRFSQ